MVWLGLAMIFFSLCSAYKANVDPYAWPQWLNNVYWGFNRLLHVIGALFILYAIFMGHFNSGLHTLKNTYFRSFGKFSFLAAIISPIIVNLLYIGSEEAIYLSNPTAMNLGAGNILCICLAVFPMYLIIEYPVTRLVYIFLTSKVEHSPVLEKAYKEQKEEERMKLAPASSKQLQYNYLPPVNPKKLAAFE
jgi:hypothetical protein